MTTRQTAPSQRPLISIHAGETAPCTCGDDIELLLTPACPAGALWQARQLHYRNERAEAARDGNLPAPFNQAATARLQELDREGSAEAQRMNRYQELRTELFLRPENRWTLQAEEPAPAPAPAPAAALETPRPPIFDEHGIDRREEYEAAADRHLAAWWEIQRRKDAERARTMADHLNASPSAAAERAALEEQAAGSGRRAQEARRRLSLLNDDRPLTTGAALEDALAAIGLGEPPRACQICGGPDPDDPEHPGLCLPCYIARRRGAPAPAAGSCLSCAAPVSSPRELWCDYHLSLLREGVRVWRESWWENLSPEESAAGYRSAALDGEFGPMAPAAHTSRPSVGGL